MKLFKRLLSRCFKRLLSDTIEKCVRNQILCRYALWGDVERLKIAASATVNNALFNTSSGTITIEEDVFFGHSVSVLTGTHDPDSVGGKRRSWPTSGYDIVIKRGAWVASNATILGPCVIGEDAVVAACSLVKNDVPAKTIVAGVPAKIIRMIRETPENCPAQNK